MSRTRRQLIRIAVTGILFLLCFAGSAFALQERTLTAGCPSLGGEKVTGRWKDGEIVLSLPGTWDLSKMTLEMDGIRTLLAGEEKQEIPAGQETDLSGLAGRKVPLWDKEKNEGRGTLTILQGSKLPTLFLTVDGEMLKKVNRSKEYMITEGRAVYAEADGTVTYDGPLEQLKGRGNNSFRYMKKPYQLKLAEKASLSGMGRGKTWVLLANWTDISLLRNQVVLDMSREIGLRNAVDCVQADVWINGEYQGLYLMTEKIQAGRDRLDITNLEKATEKVNPAPFDPGKMLVERTGEHPVMRCYPDIRDPEDITGGYLMTVEKTHRIKDYPLAGFRTADGLSIHIKEPTFPSRGQAEYLFNRVTEMQKALMAQDESFRDYIDTASFARRFLIEDWSKNYDYVGGSQFLYKDSDRIDSRFYAGPSWDYDLSFGNMKDRGWRPEGNYLTNDRKKNHIHWLVYSHASFQEEVREVWRKLFLPAARILTGEREAAEGSAVCSLDEYRRRIEASAEMNFKRWYVNTAATVREAGQTFSHAVDYLKGWIRARNAWMENQYGSVPAEAGQ